MVIRLYGLKTTIFSMRSLNAGGIYFRIKCAWLCACSLISFSIDFDTSDYIDFISSSVGYPVNWHTFYNWSKVEFPANKGFCAKTSYIMQPKLQISAGVEYDFEPKSTYGARYQRVATPSVRIGVL